MRLIFLLLPLFLCGCASNTERIKPGEQHSDKPRTEEQAKSEEKKPKKMVDSLWERSLGTERIIPEEQLHQKSRAEKWGDAAHQKMVDSLNGGDVRLGKLGKHHTPPAPSPAGSMLGQPPF